jgi:hypothetical protein
VNSQRTRLTLEEVVLAAIAAVRVRTRLAIGTIHSGPTRRTDVRDLELWTDPKGRTALLGNLDTLKDALKVPYSDKGEQ